MPNGVRVDRWSWWACLVWVAAAFVIWPLDIGRAQITALTAPEAVKNVLLYVLTIFDPLGIVLAAAALYFHTMIRESTQVARRSAVAILAISSVVEWIGLKTGYPFGPFIYTDRLGMRLGGVPISIPLLWFVLVVAARFTVLHFWRNTTRARLALLTGAFVALMDSGLELIAWKIRAFRLWYFPQANSPDWPPFQNDASRFLLAAAMAWMAFPGKRSAGKHTQPVILLITVNVLFVVTILARRYL